MAIEDSRGEKAAAALVVQWAGSGSEEVGPDLKKALQELVRHKVGDVLLEEGLWAAIDLERLTSDIVGRLETDLNPAKLALLENAVREISSEILVDEEPQEVTRWLWMWDKDDPDSAKYVEEQLFRAIQVELRKRIFRILHQSKFVGMNYKINQAELVSELYVKLKHYGIPRLPDNRRQFYGFVDKAIENILLDMQKAANRQKRPPTKRKEPLLDVFVDDRASQNPLQLLLDAEDPSSYIEKRLRLEKNRKALPPRQQEIFRLRSNGVSLVETAEIIGVSVATVKRDFSNALAQLTKALSVPEDGTPA